MQQPKISWQDVKPTEAQALRQAFGGFATGVAIVTCLDAEQQPVGLTINSFSSVSLEPALVLWSLVNHSPSRKLFEQAEHFAINILGAEQQHIGVQFAKPIVDKFQHGLWEVAYGKAPVLADCVVQFICRRNQQIEAGDHQIFLGEIEHCRHSNQRPLLFCKGQFNAWPQQFQEVS